MPRPWGLVVNVAAVLLGAVMLVNLAWPRAEFYGAEWYQQYAVLIFVPLLAVVGLLFYRAVDHGGGHGSADAQSEDVEVLAGGR